MNFLKNKKGAFDPLVIGVFTCIIAVLIFLLVFVFLL